MTEAEAMVERFLPADASVPWSRRRHYRRTRAELIESITIQGDSMTTATPEELQCFIPCPDPGTDVIVLADQPDIAQHVADAADRMGATVVGEWEVVYDAERGGILGTVMAIRSSNDHDLI